jgi:hypothetical protein
MSNKLKTMVLLNLNKILTLYIQKLGSKIGLVILQQALKWIQ